MAMLRNRKQRRTEVLERPEYGWIWKPLLILVVLYLVVCIALGIWWSQRPNGFDVDQAMAEWRGQATPEARGTVTTAALVTAIDTLLDKPGGYLRNDMAPPGLWLDNMPSWEYGVLSQARLLTRALPAMNTGEAGMLDEAQELLESNSRDWLYPAAEKRYDRAIGTLNNYLLATLSSDNATGFADNGDGLTQWLRSVEQRFADLTHRLSASINDPEALRELGINEADLPDATPWHQIDNNFFEARGDAWALRHFLEAIKRDYADVLAKAEVTSILDRMIAELEMAQRRLWSPLVLNGSGFGIFANHSLLLANYTMSVRDQARELALSVEGVEVEPLVQEETQAAQGETSPPAEGAPAPDESTEEEPGTSGDDAITPPEPAEAAPEAPVAPPFTDEEPPVTEDESQQ